MSANTSDDMAARLQEKIAAAGELLIVTHTSPDGDALGSAAALARSAALAGKQATVLVPDRVPRRYSFLFDNNRPAHVRDFPRLSKQAELIVVVDTCSFSQLAPVSDGLIRLREKVVVIDHHATRDNVAEVQWIDTSAAACGIMVAELIGQLNWTIDVGTAEALATAVVSDTGWLRFSNTDARTVRLFAELVETGVEADQLYGKLYHADRPERLKLLARALQSLELHARGRIACMTIRKTDFEQIGALAEETEEIINEAMRIETVEVAVLVVEDADRTRISLRSRTYVDVSAIARSFGGGGHARAAGLRIAQPLEQAREKIISACQQALK